MEVTLVLGGGGARGIAHVGVLKALTERGINIKRIVGTSAGSLIGALYAYHHSAQHVEAIVLQADKKQLLNKKVNFYRGLSDGVGLHRFITSQTNAASFTDLSIPLYCVCLDFLTGDVVMVDQGNVALAVQASCALPPIFQPVLVDERMLVDGGAVAPVPVDIARGINNADLIIAVNVGCELPEKLPRSALGILTRYNIMRNRELNRRTTETADIIIRPKLPGADILDDSNKLAFIDAGYAAAIKALDSH